MKRTIRTALFETNSSSTHSCIIGPRSTIALLQSNDYVYINEDDLYGGKSKQLALEIKAQLQKEQQGNDTAAKKIIFMDGKKLTWCSSKKNFFDAWQIVQPNFWQSYGCMDDEECIEEYKQAAFDDAFYTVLPSFDDNENFEYSYTPIDGTEPIEVWCCTGYDG